MKSLLLVPPSELSGLPMRSLMLKAASGELSASSPPWEDGGVALPSSLDLHQHKTLSWRSTLLQGERLVCGVLLSTYPITPDFIKDLFGSSDNDSKSEEEEEEEERSSSSSLTENDELENLTPLIDIEDKKSSAITEQLWETQAMPLIPRDGLEITSFPIFKKKKLKAKLVVFELTVTVNPDRLGIDLLFKITFRKLSSKPYSHNNTRSSGSSTAHCKRIYEVQRSLMFQSFGGDDCDKQKCRIVNFLSPKESKNAQKAMGIFSALMRNAILDQDDHNDHSNQILQQNFDNNFGCFEEAHTPWSVDKAGGGDIAGSASLAGGGQSPPPTAPPLKPSSNNIDSLPGVVVFTATLPVTVIRPLELTTFLVQSAMYAKVENVTKDFTIAVESIHARSAESAASNSNALPVLLEPEDEFCVLLPLGNEHLNGSGSSDSPPGGKRVLPLSLRWRVHGIAPRCSVWTQFGADCQVEPISPLEVSIVSIENSQDSVIVTFQFTNHETMPVNLQLESTICEELNDETKSAPPSPLLPLLTKQYIGELLPSGSTAQTKTVKVCFLKLNRRSSMSSAQANLTLRDLNTDRKFLIQAAGVLCTS